MTRILLRRKVTETAGQRILSHYILEWNPEANGHWYPINSKNVIPAEMNPEFTEKYRAVMDQVLEGKTVEVGADYCRSQRTLVVFHAPN